MAKTRTPRVSATRRLRDLNRALEAVRKEARSLEVQLRRETREPAHQQHPQAPGLVHLVREDG